MFHLLWSRLLCCEVWNMISERTSMWQARVSNCDGSRSADITVPFPSEVIKVFRNNTCESVRIMASYGFPLLNSVRIAGSLMTSESPDHLIWRQSLDTQLLECWTLCYLIRSASSKHLALSLSLCSTARPAAIAVWIKILLNTVLPLQSGQRVGLQLMMALCRLRWKQQGSSQ